MKSWTIAYFALVVAFFLVGLVVGGPGGALIASVAFVIGTTFGARWITEEHRD